ncbi:MAG: TatD family hydrolase [Candidatus Dojkabacteria bacterium]|nr:TatD family hydrolase [Candidatus Dojkabacteria bacterium]
MKSLFELFGKPEYLFDSHAHINDESYDEDLKKIIQNAQDNNVKEIFDVSVNKISCEKSILISKENEFVKSFIGIDPDVLIPTSELFEGLHFKIDWFNITRFKLSKLIENNIENVIGVGETGIDLYWIEKALADGQINEFEYNESIRLQRELFELHLDIAKEFVLPLTIHSRNAEDLCLEIVKSKDAVGIFHSYGGDYEIAKRILDNGWGLGVNGIVTFKNAEDVRKMYRKILGKISYDVSPSDFYEKGIFFETDSPFLTPHPKRGTRNEPANVSSIFEQFIASLIND